MWGLCAAAFFVLHAVLAWVLRSPGVTTGQDDAHYLILAESLGDFQYRDDFRVDAPPHSRYPPVFPAMLAAWRPLVGGHYDGFVVLNILLSIAGLALVYRAVARLWSPGVALACVAPSALIAEQVLQPGLLWSEMAYFFFTAAALEALSDQPTRGRHLRAGAAAILAALTRSIGVALVAAVVLHWMLERRKAATGAFVAASALTVGAWLVWTAVAPEQNIGRSYMRDITRTAAVAAAVPAQVEAPGPLATRLDRVLHNGAEYAYPTIGYHLAAPNVPGTEVDNVVAAVGLLALIALGLIQIARRWRPAALYLLLYAGILLLWPYVYGRLLVPIVPLLFLAVVLGLQRVVGFAAERWNSAGSSRPASAQVSRVPPGSIAVLLLTVATTTWGLARTARSIGERSGCDRETNLRGVPCVTPDVASFFTALDYVRTSLPPDAVLLSVTPEPLYIFTRRKSPPVDEALNVRADGFLPFLREYGTSHILLTSLLPADLRLIDEQLVHSCGGLSLVEAFPPRTYLFALREDGEPPASDACTAVAEAKLANQGRSFDLGP